jgi:hypothetical protein
MFVTAARNLTNIAKFRHSEPLPVGSLKTIRAACRDCGGGNPEARSPNFGLAKKQDGAALIGHNPAASRSSFRI